VLFRSSVANPGVAQADKWEWTARNLVNKMPGDETNNERKCKVIGIKGIELTLVTVELNETEGKQLLSGAYALISTVDKVLAKQDFNNQYGETLKVHLSRETLEARVRMIELLKKDVEAVVGLV
jgi:hypothetical protein